MKVGYSKQQPLGREEGDEGEEGEDEQAELDLGCISCNNQVPFTEGSDSEHTNGQKCTAPKGAIASAREATGRTPGRQGRRGPQPVN